MIRVDYDEQLLKQIDKIKDTAFASEVAKKIEKIKLNPEVGKPMRNARKGTREVYLGSYRLSYAYFREEGRLKFLEIYHKDEQ